MVDSLNAAAKHAFTRGNVQCEPQFESGNITYKKESSGGRATMTSPIGLPIRCDLRHNDDAKDPKGEYKLEFKLSVPTTEFENPEKLQGAKTERAHFVENFYSVFGPHGSSNKVLADNLKTIIKPLKKAKGSALFSAANDKNVFAAIAKDCERGVVAGAGTSPQFSPKQTLKFWTNSYEKDGVTTSTTFAQITFAVTNLFVESDKSAEEHEAECAQFRAGSELHGFLTAHPELSVNKGAFRVSVAREGKNPPSWIDIANLISVSDPANQSNKAVTVIGQLQASPWQTWLNKDRMRILFKTYLNSIDIYAIERPYMPDGTKKLVINMAAAEAFDRKRKTSDSNDSNDIEDSDDCTDTEPQSDVDEVKPAKRQRLDNPEAEKMLATGNAADLAD